MASCERAEEGRSPESERSRVYTARLRAFGEGAVLLCTPSEPRTPGADEAAAFSAAAQPKLGVAPASPASPAHWLRGTQSAVSEQKPLLR